MLLGPKYEGGGIKIKRRWEISEKSKKDRSDLKGSGTLLNDFEFSTPSFIVVNSSR